MLIKVASQNKPTTTQVNKAFVKLLYEGLFGIEGLIKWLLMKYVGIEMITRIRRYLIYVVNFVTPLYFKNECLLECFCSSGRSAPI